MKIKEITFAMKKGMPDYGSVQAGATAEVTETDNLEESFEKLRAMVEIECDADSSALRPQPRPRNPYRPNEK